jgi:hypothetical protein
LHILGDGITTSIRLEAEAAQRYLMISSPSDTEQGIINAVGGNLLLEAGGVVNIRMQSDGKIGIGNISSESNLGVNGNVTVGSSWADTIAAPANGMIIEGNVGIGTTSPTHKLAVEGVIASGSVFTNGELRSYQLNGGGAYISVKTDSALGKTGIYRSNVDAFPFYYDTSTGASVVESTVPNQPIQFKYLGAEKMRITYNGNVGIGTTSPKNKLDVEGGVAIGATYSGTNTAPSNGAIIEGNVGIGTTSPTAKLHLPAGVATAGGSSLKITAGVGLTTPESGAIFFDGVDLFLDV